MNDKKIGIQIKKARAEAQITQSELGGKIGVTWEMVSRYENGKSSPRKNLEKIAEVLGKPIQYFFGVEEVPIKDEIKRLTDLLERKGEDIGRGAEVPLLDYLEEYNLEQSLDLTKQTYTCPSWVFSNFKNVFALKLDQVHSEVVNIGSGDIGYLSSTINPEVGNYVLVKDRNVLRIERFSKFQEEVVAVLIAVEKRYLEV